MTSSLSTLNTVITAFPRLRTVSVERNMCCRQIPRRVGAKFQSVMIAKARSELRCRSSISSVAKPRHHLGPLPPSSFQTSNCTSKCAPKKRIRGTSAASRPRATPICPTRGLMFPGSKPVPHAVGAAVKRVPDVLECHLMAGTADYLLKVVAQDTDDFARIHRQHLARLPGVAQMHSSFALRTVFKTTALPV